MKFKLFSFFFLGLMFSLNAQVNFQDNIIIQDLDFYDANNNTTDIGDVDGDGDIDFVFGINNEVGWLENLDGQGNFSDTKIVDIALTSRKIYAVDLDGDDDLDILSGDETRIIWYENTDGLGSFDIQHEINFNGINVNFSDVDGDGDMDIVAANASLVWFENIDGQGNFSSSQIITTTEPISVFHFTDIDGDNDLDIVGGENYPEKRIVWYENTNGLGDYGIANEIAILNFGTLQEYSPSALSSIDFDNDGDMDILATTDTNVGDLVWFENTDGQGTFGVETDFGSHGSAIETIDINGDGFLDIIKAGGDNEGPTIWYKNNGNGSFTGLNSYILDHYTGSTIIVKPADIDGDGDIDIASASLDNSTISWHENLDALGSFSDEKILLTSVVIPNDVRSVDVDGDGDLDVLCTSDYSFTWFENEDGQGNFGRVKIIDLNDTGNNYLNFKGIQTSDIDLDGDIDVICYSNLGGVRWYENMNGLGTFVKRGLGGVAESMKITDLDADGDDDILIAKNYENGIVWRENIDGQGTFSDLQTIITAAIWSELITVADIDSDGDNDIVSTSDYSITWYENIDGQGNFSTTAQTITNGFDNLGAIYCTDIDGDADIDIIAIDYGVGSFQWHENIDGQGNFGAGTSISEDNVGVISISDVDNDGDNDIVSTFGYDIVWYENTNSMGTFGAKQTISTLPEFPRSIFVSDLDLDGDLDVLSSSHGDHRITWYDNPLVDILSVNDQEVNIFAMYPNPVSNNLIINSRIHFTAIAIYDFNGRRLNTIKIPSNLNYSLDVNHLSQGLYFIEIQSGKFKQTQKFIKK